MLASDTKLNFETISEIKEQGYSRIPIYTTERTNIVYILFAKDLLFIDPDDDKPIEEVCKFYSNQVNHVYSDTSLTEMLDEFKSGEKGHMAVVQEVNRDGDCDPYHDTIGIVTLEDIIEEIIQQEINDETDIITDNKSKKKRKKERCRDREFKMFLGTRTHQRVVISPQMSLAILQFLTTSVRAFFPEHCSQRTLRKLLNMDVYRQIKVSKSRKETNLMDVDIEDEFLIMKKGKPCDFFVLILEGRVEVVIGKEEHKFHEGPFSYYGEAMLEAALVPRSSSLSLMTCTSSPGTSSSLSSQASSRPPLSKASTQLQLITSGDRSGAASGSGKVRN